MNTIFTDEFFLLKAFKPEHFFKAHASLSTSFNDFFLTS